MMLKVHFNLSTKMVDMCCCCARKAKNKADKLSARRSLTLHCAKPLSLSLSLHASHASRSWSAHAVPRCTRERM